MVVTALYRFYDVTGRLLYVGISRSPFTRFDEHSRQLYWDDIETIRLERHPTLEAAREAEITAIQTECPIYNIADTRYEPAPRCRCHNCDRFICVTPLGTFRPHKKGAKRCGGSGRFAPDEAVA